MCGVHRGAPLSVWRGGGLRMACGAEPGWALCRSAEGMCGAFVCRHMSEQWVLGLALRSESDGEHPFMGEPPGMILSRGGTRRPSNLGPEAPMGLGVIAPKLSGCWI